MNSHVQVNTDNHEGAASLTKLEDTLTHDPTLSVDVLVASAMNGNGNGNVSGSVNDPAHAQELLVHHNHNSVIQQQQQQHLKPDLSELKSHVANLLWRT